MIKYQLRCDAEHEFEGWFRNSADFEAQAADGLCECPLCGSTSVRKAIMAPSISTKNGARDKRLGEIRQAMAEAARRARDYVEKNYEYVGEHFPEEARRIHYGETEERGIFGEASGAEAKELIEEGISIAPIPRAQEADVEAAPAKPQIATPKKTLN